MQEKILIPNFHFDADKTCYCSSKKNFGQCCGSLSEGRSIPDGLFIVNNFLSELECKQFLRFAEKQRRSWLMITDQKKSSGKKMAGKKDPGRVTQQVQLGKKEATVIDWLKKACIQRIQPALNAWTEWIEHPQLLRYGVGGKYSRHADAEEYNAATGQHFRVMDRDVSLLIYLNDDYEGGGLNFSGLNFQYQPVAGDLVFFPSNHIFTHESLPVISGKKYALVTWGSLQGSKRMNPLPPYPVIRL